METIDKLTLELLMNKNTYSRYIEKTDPSKHKEEKQFRKKINKYKTRMLSLTIKHLDDPNFQINNELSSMISEYARTFIKYFEMNDLESSCFYGNDNQKKNNHDDDDDNEGENTLFGNMDTKETENTNKFDDDFSSIAADDGSVTAEQANKFLYRYTMDKYVKRK
jgi:hypothetical protein